MASKLLRRSGVAVGLVAEVLKWRADLVVQVGVGLHHEETDVLAAEWPGVRFLGFEALHDIVTAIDGSYPGDLYNYAITDRDDENVAVYVRTNHKDGSSLFSQGQVVNSRMVRTKTLDTVMVPATLPPRHRVLLWLDCEGSEAAALDGGRELLKRVEMINVEMTAKPDGERCRPGDVHRRLLEEGFWLVWIHTQRISAGQCDYIYVREPLFDPHYCCIPHEVERWENRLNSA